MVSLTELIFLKKMKMFKWFGTIVGFALIALIILFTSCDKLILYGILMALESWIIRAITKRYCKKHYLECRKEELKKYYDKNRIKEFTSFAGWNLVNIASDIPSIFIAFLLVNKLNLFINLALQNSFVQYKYFTSLFSFIFAS